MKGDKKEKDLGDPAIVLHRSKVSDPMGQSDVSEGEELFIIHPTPGDIGVKLIAGLVYRNYQGDTYKVAWRPELA